MRTTIPLHVLLALALPLAGCSSLSSLTTGSVGGSEAKPPAPQGPIVVTDPLRRAIKVAETSARAERCGYHFDPDRMRTAYLATEVQQNALDATSAGKLTSTYDLARRVTLQETNADPNFCSSARTAQIKTALSRHLTGDFVVVDEPKKASEGLFGSLASDPTTEKLNPEWILDPRNNKVTTRRSE
jgi:hypothetical protein